MKALLFSLFAACSLAACAQDAGKVTELEQRIRNLEERMDRMEQATGGQQSNHAKKMSNIARQHAAEDRNSYKPEDIAKAEELYERAARLLKSDGSKPLLDSVVLLYPKLNRAGCAQLYRAQQESGEERVRLLKDCIDRFSTCYYLDGTQVGPFAMMLLAYHYKQNGNEQNARKLFARIRSESPEAIGHDGELLLDKME